MSTLPDRNSKLLATVVYPPGNSGHYSGFLAFFKRAHKQETTYQVWEEGNHQQIIESEAVMRQKLNYIHYNPVKRGYVDQPEHWRYSRVRVIMQDRRD